MTSFILRIEPDDMWRNEGKFMVCIYREASEGRAQRKVGVPMRDVSYEKAREGLSQLEYAFRFGLTAMEELQTTAMWRISTAVESKP